MFEGNKDDNKEEGEEYIVEITDSDISNSDEKYQNQWNSLIRKDKTL